MTDVYSKHYSIVIAWFVFAALSAISCKTNTDAGNDRGEGSDSVDTDGTKCKKRIEGLQWI